MIGNQVMSGSVSVIELFRRWDSGDLKQWVGEEGAKEEVELTWEEFLERLNAPATSKMSAGKAFHAGLEQVQADNNFERLEADGYLFDFAELDCILDLGQVREIPTSKTYGDLLVRGRIDIASGSTITDYKLTFGSFDAERYSESFQWRFYLDMLKADIFVYKVFEGYEDRQDVSVIGVKRLHTLRLYRYPEMEAECEQLAKRFHDVALRHPSIAKIRDVDEL